MVTNATRTVLIADDETLFTQSLSEGLLALEWGLSVRTAANGREAVDVLRREAVDLVVTDLKMPEMDGFELLAWMSRETPTVPVIVMTAFGTPEIAERLRSFVLESFVEKPVDFATLSERISGALDDAARGFVSGIPLSTFLQILEIERRSCTLRVHSGARAGLLHLVAGAPWDAEAGDLRGELFISVDDAVRQARDFGTSPGAELLRYLVHGVLHLRGYDDRVPAERRVMKRAEDRLVRRLAERFPPRGLLR